MRKRVLVVGSVNMDLVIRAELPRPGETRIGRDFRTIPGGKGANQAVAAARLGGRTSMIGRIGADAFGEALIAGMSGAGVDVAFVEAASEEPTGVALILVQPDGDNSIVLASGANGSLRPEHLERARSCFDEAAVVLLQFEIPIETVDCALDLARRHGCRSILDAGPAVAAPPEVLAKAYVLSPNEAETEALLGTVVNDKETAGDAASRFRKRGVENVLLKLGDRGALLDSPAGQEWFPAFPIDPVDTTAAGDAFTGAVGVAIAEDWEWSRIVRFANAAGALACLAAGAQPSLPDRLQVNDFLHRHVDTAKSAS